MIIKKILNNNVITTIDEATRLEQVVMGRGIAFQKKTGDKVDQSRVEKVFQIQNQTENAKFQQLVNEIPLEYIQISEKIISYAKECLQSKLDDHIYVALTDHLAFAIKRAQSGMHIKNHLLWEIRRIHAKEYEVGHWATDYIEQELGVEMLEDEAAFIALHLVNASLGKSMPETYSLTTIVQDILNIIKYNFIVEFDQEDISYDRLLTHLKFFAQRVLTKKTYPDEEQALLQTIKENYKKYYECALKIKTYIEKNYDHQIQDGELVYLSLHLYRVISRLKTAT